MRFCDFQRRHHSGLRLVGTPPGTAPSRQDAHVSTASFGRSRLRGRQQPSSAGGKIESTQSSERSHPLYRGPATNRSPARGGERGGDSWPMLCGAHSSGCGEGLIGSALSERATQKGGPRIPCVEGYPRSGSAYRINPSSGSMRPAATRGNSPHAELSDRRHGPPRGLGPVPLRHCGDHPRSGLTGGGSPLRRLPPLFVDSPVASSDHSPTTEGGGYAAKKADCPAGPASPGFRHLPEHALEAPSHTGQERACAADA